MMYRSTRPVSIFYKTFDAQHRVSRDTRSCLFSAVDSGGAGGARAPPEFGGSEKGRSLIFAYQSIVLHLRRCMYVHYFLRLNMLIFTLRVLIWKWNEGNCFI